MRKPHVQPCIACSSRVCSAASPLLSFARRNGFQGIEYSITSETPDALTREAENMELLGKSDIEIRYHTPFQDIELGHGDVAKAEASARFMKKCIDIVEDKGGKFITAHLCLGYRFSLETLNIENAIRYLYDVSNYARNKGIGICLENLTYGWTNDPNELLRIVEETGVSVTIDIGHLAACPMVQSNSLPAQEFIRILSQYVVGSHIYKIEIFDAGKCKPIHMAPKEREDIEPMVNELMKTKCGWWLIELGDKIEVMRTRQILSEILSVR